jgi:signal transduction histidine kinase/DNA-binding response OmpR family regulator
LECEGGSLDMEDMTPKINILLVDDNPNNLLSLETILEGEDRNLVRASSGEDALRYLLDRDAAVILLDVHMPRIDGLETAALIRGRERLRDVPIIFLTAYDSAGNSQLTKGYSLGAVDYIVKPVDPAMLRAKVAVFVELFRKTEQIKQQADQLREKTIELENANLQRLSRLVELGQQLATERDPERLLELFCHEARDIVNARYAAVGMVDADHGELQHFFASGFDPTPMKEEELSRLSRYFFSERFKNRRSIRRKLTNAGAKLFPFLPADPLVHSFLGAQLVYQGRIHGWLLLAGKKGVDEFNRADERLTSTLTSQAIVAWENARLYADTQRHALNLEQEIAERRQIEKERAELLVREQAARREAESANRLKDEFLATVSHELRAPLNATLGWITLIRGEKLDEETETRALEIVERSARAQSKLIDDLLDVSRITTGKLRLDLHPTELVTIIEAVVESVRPAAEAKGVTLQTRTDSPCGHFQADSARLQQVIWNLVSNAVKFTPEGGRVEVELHSPADHVEIVVRDTGIGIAPEFLPYVFDRFRQADAGSTRKHSGLGLGLSIVRYLVEMHGGSVQAASGGEGLGATFTISLPRNISLSGLAEIEGSESRRLQIKLSDGVPKLKGLRALVVDDQAEARDLLAAILNLSEAEVRTAGGIDEAMNVLAVWRPEVIISDIAMPGGDGYELLRRIRQDEKRGEHRIPAVAITGNAGAKDRIRALSAGFQLHLPKPIEPDELVISIASLIGNSRKGIPG